MDIFILVIVAVVYTAFVALVFSGLTLLLGMMFKSFSVSGPDDWSFVDFYKRYLIIAAVYVCITMPLGCMCWGIPGIGAMALAYKFVFDAGWTQALVMGTVGGIIALMLFVAMWVCILAPLRLLPLPTAG